MALQKPKILLVGDIPYWAFYYMSEFIINELSPKYDFYMDYCIFHQSSNHINEESFWKPYKRKLRTYLNYFKYYHKRRLLPRGQKYDLICYLGWYLPHIYDFKIKGDRIIQGIFSDGFPPQGPGLEIDPQIEIPEFVNKYLGHAVAVICGSKTIHERFQKHVRSYYCTGAIDTEMFKPCARNQSDKNSFIVGWTGNPNRSFKGFYDFVIPAVEKAALMRKGITLKTRFKGPYDTLPGFYGDVDALLIASSADAGPSSFLEAGACGIPSISTRVGFPAEVIRDGENGLFVNRSIEEMVAALIYLYDDRKHLRRMSEQIRRDIEENWNYQLRSRLWDKMFKELLAL